MALTSRIAFDDLSTTEEAEDYLGSSLGVIFPDDVMNQHGDADSSLVYTSPHLPNPLHIVLADPKAADDRALFGHHLWNSSLLLAEFVEAGTLGLPYSVGSDIRVRGDGDTQPYGSIVRDFDIKELSSIELGAGTALPSILASLLDAKAVVVTDYPSQVLMDTLRKNVETNCTTGYSPVSTLTRPTVVGHAWGELDTEFAVQHKHSFDRVFVCDCLWMPWQHLNLQKSIAHFMKGDESARAWVIGGLHTGRSKMRGFFEQTALQQQGLEVERIWERDCDGVERPWNEDRGIEDVTERKRWLIVGVLKRSAAAKR
ncbi:hypothetical protein F5Y15DRAFT_213382 [Xylariaceae sp. FL0016]|nr:hypothetical protein F5Y15DRAFT_213382 [Xylariaceae sp. FL0016]